MSGPTLDPDVKEELESVLSEEEIIGMYHSDGSSEERVPIVQQFSPDSEEWGGKTIFEEGQPRTITLADNLSEAFPLLLPSEEFITNVVADYEMRLTSKEGIGREQLTRLYQSMFGGATGADGETPQAIRFALSAGPDDE